MMTIMSIFSNLRKYIFLILLIILGISFFFTVHYRNNAKENEQALLQVKQQVSLLQNEIKKQNKALTDYQNDIKRQSEFITEINKKSSEYKQQIDTLVKSLETRDLEKEAKENPVEFTKKINNDLIIQFNQFEELTK